MKFSLDKSCFKDFSFDRTSFEEDDLDIMNIKENNIYKSLGDDDNGELQLRVKKHIFRLA